MSEQACCATDIRNEIELEWPGNKTAKLFSKRRTLSEKIDVAEVNQGRKRMKKKNERGDGCVMKKS